MHLEVLKDRDNLAKETFNLAGKLLTWYKGELQDQCKQEQTKAILHKIFVVNGFKRARWN